MAQTQVSHPGPENNYRRQSTNDYLFSLSPTLDEMGAVRPAPGISPLARFMALRSANPTATVEELVNLRRAQ